MTEQQAVEKIKEMSRYLMELSNNIGVDNSKAFDAVIEADSILQDYLKGKSNAR